MKIALSWINTGAPKTGLEVFAARFIEALPLVDRDNQYLVTGEFWKNFRTRTTDTVASLPEGFTHRFYQRPRNLVNFLDWKFRLFFRERDLRREKVDVYHGIDETLPPLKKTKSVITVHDIGFKIHPEWFPASRSPFSWHYTLGRSLKQSDMIIAVSRYTKEEIVDYYKVPPEKVKVIYSGGAGKESRVIEDATRLSSFRERYRLKERFILSVAPTSSHKNVVRVVEAFGLIAANYPDLNLVLVGSPGRGHQAVIDTVKRLNLIKKTVFFSDVLSSELVSFYNLAEIFLFPSLYEGFGLPVLEAMACGCPVITSNVASLPEVAGNAALLVNPYRTEEIADGLKKLLHNRELREEFKRKGLEHARLFSWERTARETLEIYREITA
ncbi:MAG: glycosyltransferase family 1 protein [Candidatus Ratteibacteria bacterium]